jgi:hypothetical protein
MPPAVRPIPAANNAISSQFMRPPSSSGRFDFSDRNVQIAMVIPDMTHWNEDQVRNWMRLASTWRLVIAVHRAKNLPMAHSILEPEMRQRIDRLLLFATFLCSALALVRCA